MFIVNMNQLLSIVSDFFIEFEIIAEFIDLKK